MTQPPIAEMVERIRYALEMFRTDDICPKEAPTEKHWPESAEVALRALAELEKHIIREEGADNLWRECPQLSDEAWEFIQDQGDTSPDFENTTFGGDWGNWNWLFKEIYARCTKAPDKAGQ